MLRQGAHASGLFLGQDKRVYGGSGRPAIAFSTSLYVVVRVTRDPLNTPDWLIDQKAATLLAELEHGKRTGRGEALGFLRKHPAAAVR